jgi:hypothetical protein
MRYHPRSADSVASISADEVFSCPHGITCATFGSNGVFIAAGTESSGWFAIDLNSRQHFSKIVPNLPPGCCAHSILSICALPVLKSGSAGIADVMDGRDFAVASRFASGSIIHIWKFSEFKLKYEVVKELQLDGEANSTVTSLICSRDSFEDPDSFKILALDGSSTGHLISYLGGHCYGPCIEPVNFHCPMHHKPVNVTRAAWSTMARAVCFCDFSTGASKEVGGFWWGLPRLCDIRRSGGGTPVSNPWQTNHREKFGQAFTCDLSVHSYIREVQAGEELDEDLQCVEGVWNHDVVVHQQVVSDVADRWKELAKATRMRPDVVDRVVQQIAVTPPLAPPSVFLIQFDVFLIHFYVFLIQFDVFLIQFDVFLIHFDVFLVQFADWLNLNLLVFVGSLAYRVLEISHATPWLSILLVGQRVVRDRLLVRAVILSCVLLFVSSHTILQLRLSFRSDSDHLSDLDTSQHNQKRIGSLGFLKKLADRPMSLEHCSRLVPGRRALRRALLLSHTHSLKSTKTEIPMPTSLRICSAHC